MGLPRPHTHLPKKNGISVTVMENWEPSWHASNRFLEKNIKISYMVGCSTLLCCCS